MANTITITGLSRVGKEETFEVEISPDTNCSISETDQNQPLPNRPPKFQLAINKPDIILYYNSMEEANKVKEQVCPNTH